MKNDINTPGNLHLSQIASSIITYSLYIGSIFYMYKTDLICRIITANRKIVDSLESEYEPFGIQKNWCQYFGMGWIVLSVLFLSVCIASIMSVFENRENKFNKKEFRRCLFFAFKLLLVFGTLSFISSIVAFSLLTR